MRFLSWRWSSGAMPSAVRVPAAFRLSGRSRSRCRGHGLTQACRCGCDDCLRAEWSRRRPAGSGRCIDRGTFWIPRRPHRRALLPRFAPPFRRHQDSGSGEHRGNAANLPRTVTSAHRTDVDQATTEPIRKSSHRPWRYFTTRLAMPVGRISWTPESAANYAGLQPPARRQDTWFLDRLRARACQKRRAGSGPLPRQIRPTQQRRRCDRGRGRDPAGRNGQTNAARRSIPRA